MNDKKTPRKLSQEGNIEGTIYAKKWLLQAIDEAHVNKRLNRAWIANTALQQISRFTIAMTATPVTTSPLVSVQHQSLLTNTDLLLGSLEYREIPWPLRI